MILKSATIHHSVCFWQIITLKAKFSVSDLQAFWTESFEKVEGLCHRQNVETSGNETILIDIKYKYYCKADDF